MKILDFDKTIYDGDIAVDFYRYCIKRYPKTLLTLPLFLWGFALYMFGIINKTVMKEHFYTFLKKIPDPEKAVAEFTATATEKIKPWYREILAGDDYIISASPEFLVKRVTDKLGIHCIASRVDIKTGKYDGENCHGEEKVKRLELETGETCCDEFYSDSLSDKPLAELADKAFIVKGDEIIPWEEYKQPFFSKFISTFFTPNFFIFVFCGGCGTLVNFLFSLLFSEKLNETLSYVFGYGLSLFVTYLLNSFLIFKQKLSPGRFVKFVVSYIPNFLILFTFVAVLLNIFHVWKVIVYAGAAVFGLPVTYLIVKIFAFGGKGEKSDV
jgi:HAD superfamily phosphoserine phosphatase-like hydrolase